MTLSLSGHLSGAAYQRVVERARGELAGPDHRGMLGQIRAEVAESWRRSLVVHGGLGKPLEPRLVTDSDLREVRQGHPLAPVLPIIRRLLVEPAADANLIVAVGNAEGHLLWVEGDDQARRRADAMGFVPGADWSEASMGTSAPGTALYSGRPVQVSRAEHFNPVVHPWSCSAVPLRDPADGRIVGVIDLTGGDEAISPLALPLLKAAAEAVHSAWQERLLPSPVPAPVRGSILHVTGGLPPRLAGSDGAWREIPGKHAEILTLLTWHGAGLDGAELEELVYGYDAGTTLRAEVHRLRRALEAGVPGVTLRARPYRLEGALATDAVLAREALRRGEVSAALGHAAGSVLPRSAAPGIVEIRHQLNLALREAVLEDAEIEDLWTYLARPEAVGDLELWMTALKMLPVDSPRRALAVSTVERLEAEAR
ncbi:helix-turn-helix domain-containing protein [Micrococcus terreus]|uniref:GAF domain-containing protein n=1 Tax=Micrococcus terreus TaxID=574650 RepID=A0A1I7MQ01_9MICC|nr:helix-turn-helix domain-containing protein [Micrococcus terreus]SFV23993.1 GAF domain-containing protein [Micrococcus terreus]